MIPEVNKTYYCYDNGVVSDTRQYQVQILQVVPFEKAFHEDREAFLTSHSEDSKLFKSNPDYFVYALSYEIPERPMIEIFSRTKTNEWYGIGRVKYDEMPGIYTCEMYWCSGRLDVDGSLTRQLTELYD